jgi:hypothetical protein
MSQKIYNVYVNKIKRCEFTYDQLSQWRTSFSEYNLESLKNLYRFDAIYDKEDKLSYIEFEDDKSLTFFLLKFHFTENNS